MSKIRVKNFGPIKEGFNENDGFLDIKKITVFIGNQGTGKSTIAKLISTCKWLEKAMKRGDIDNHKSIDDIKSINEFKSYCDYQGIQNYFLLNSEIEYVGNAIFLSLPDEKNNIPTRRFVSIKHKYQVPKIMYVPAERNFLSVVKDAFNIKGLPSSLLSFAEEFKRSQKELEGQKLDLPINNYQYRYEKISDISFVISGDNVVNLLEASSGLQSSIPLFLVSRNIAYSINENIDIKNISNSLSAMQSLRLDEEFRQLTRNSALSDDEKNNKVKDILAKYHNSCFINIVEEPEQNLFPESQRHILNSLLGFANRQEANELLMTTHSPYIINYLSIAIQGNYLLDKINTSSKKEELLARLNDIIPIEACVAADDVAIYQFQSDGSICRLENYEGIPSDKNYLNQSLAKGNHLFDALLELEEEL